MKKRFAIILILLVAAVGLYAQDIKGTWRSEAIRDSLNMEYIFTFTDSTLTMKILVGHEDAEIGAITLAVLLPSTYTRSDDVIKIDYLTDEFKVKVEKMEFTEEVNKAMDDEPGMADFMKGLMEASINKGKDKLIEQFKKSDELKIWSLDDNSLVLVDETGEPMLFTRADPSAY